MSDVEQRVPEGVPIYDLTADLVALLEQPEMRELRTLLSAQGAKVLLAQLGSMDRASLMALRAKVAPPVVNVPRD